MAYYLQKINPLKIKRLIPALLVLTLVSCGGNKQPAEEAAADPGQEIYLKYCMACHQAAGSGVSGMYPTLQKTDWVTGDKTRLISLLLNGQQGEINGKRTGFQGGDASAQISYRSAGSRCADLCEVKFRKCSRPGLARRGGSNPTDTA